MTRFFETEGISGLTDEPENTAINLVGEGTRTYFEGLVSSQMNPNHNAIALRMAQKGEDIIRLSAELIARTFDISPHASAFVVDKAIDRYTPTENRTVLPSLVAARMVEGFIEARQRKLAAGLFDLRVTDSHVQEQVLKFLLERDPNVVSN